MAQEGRPLSLKVNFSWTLAGNCVQAVCRYALLVLLVYSCGLAAGGRYALAVALCTPIWSLAGFGLRGALVTDTRQQHAFADYLAARLLAMAGALVVVAGAILLADYAMQTAAMVLLVAAAKTIEGVSDILHARLQRSERMDRVAMALILRGLGSVAMMLIAVGLGGGPLLLVASLPAAMALTLLLWDLPCIAHASDANGTQLWRTAIDWNALRSLTQVAAPIAAGTFLVTLIPQLPKYVIGGTLGEESVAIYTLIAYWITLGMMVVTALGNTVTPRLAKYYAAGDLNQFRQLVGRLVLMMASAGAAGVLVVALFGPRLLALIDPRAAELPRLALALSVFAAFLYVTGPLGRALSAMRRFWTQTAIRSIGVVVALILLPPAVSTRGLTGAAEAMSVSMAVVAALLGAALWREVGLGKRHVLSPCEP